MKRLIRWSRRFAASLASMTVSAVAFAQTQAPSTVEVTKTTTTTQVWFTQWWVWAAGIAVFLIVVIALTNRGGRSSS